MKERNDRVGAAAAGRSHQAQPKSAGGQPLGHIDATDELTDTFPAAGGGSGAAVDGGTGADGAAPSGELPWRSQCGQTHSTVHFRTGTSLVTGYFASLRTSRIMHRSPQHSRPQLQSGVMPGMQISSQEHVYLYVVTVFVAQ